MNTDFKKYIQHLVRYYQRMLLLDAWTIHIEWHIPPEVGSEQDILAAINPRDNYQDAFLYIGPKLYDIYKVGDNRRVASTVLHEFAHIFLMPLYNHALSAHPGHAHTFVEDINERCTSHLEKVLFNHVPQKVWGMGWRRRG